MELASAQKLSNKLFGEISSNLDIFASMESEIRKKYWAVIFNTIKLRFLTYKFIRDCRKLEMMLMQNDCPGTCKNFKESFLQLIPILSEAAEKERCLLQNITEINIPGFLVKMHEDMLADYEDLVENFSIAVDDEIRDLVSTVSGKSLR